MNGWQIPAHYQLGIHSRQAWKDVDMETTSWAATLQEDCLQYQGKGKKGGWEE